MKKLMSGLVVALALGFAGQAGAEDIVCGSARAWVRVCKDGVRATKKQIDEATTPDEKMAAQARHDEANRWLKDAEKDRDRDCKK